MPNKDAKKSNNLRPCHSAYESCIRYVIAETPSRGLSAESLALSAKPEKLHLNPLRKGELEFASSAHHSAVDFV